MSEELEVLPPCGCLQCRRLRLVSAVAEQWQNGDQESVRFVRPELAAALDELAGGES